MPNSVSLLGPPWAVLRTQFRYFLQSRSGQTALERELADFTTDSDRLEVDAIINRHSDAVTADIRRILGAQRRESDI
ncbi:MAG TPA: hypothetical protein VG253_13610 [Streptosporangiaceae bacterium]|jgi:hypothetical protein|nr:hypothetical protein [Streptosporangiaceae bacterium]